MRKLIFTKNDIYRLTGIILLVAGQFMHKEEVFTGYGVTLESNLVQLVGAVLLLLPFVFKAIDAYKGRKSE